MPLTALAPPPAQAITGGREARVAEFPYMAGLVDVGHCVRGEHADPSS
ncbi:hypothetical protein [Streptomyces sp. NPDC056190]